MPSNRKACVVGAGSNGLAAAIVLAQAGLQVDVFEAEPIPGGATRSLELTLPGFMHDFGSAVYALAASSPFLSKLPLGAHGLEWIHSPAPLAHPLDDGTAVVLERDMEAAAAELGSDGGAWRALIEPLVTHWHDLAPDLLGPVLKIPAHPWLLARFGINALLSAKAISRRFKNERTKALFAGLAAHSFLSLDEPLSAAFGVMLGAAAHAVGWPIPLGGGRSLTKTLCGHLAALGGEIKTSTHVHKLASLPKYDATLCDVTPFQLVRLATSRLSTRYTLRLAKYRYGPAAFKVDYALRCPIPWKAPECLRAATVHLGGSAEEIADSEATMRGGRHSERPFVLLAQPSLFDPTRAPADKHTAWAYCHVPNGSQYDMLETMEAQIERFAP